MRFFASLRMTATLAVVLPAVAAAQQQQSKPRALGIDTMNFDRAVRPQDDFFRFVNGSWLARTDIPSDASSWGAFNELTEKSRNAIHGILEEVSKEKNAPGSEKQKIGDLYASFIDEARIEQLGITPLNGELQTIAKVNSSKDLPATFAHFARLGIGNPFGVGVGPDPKNSEVNIGQVNQSGLGLPNRDYYLRNDPAIANARIAYVAYITQLLTLAKQNDPAGAAQRILARETVIATPQWPAAKNRDRNLTYNKMSVADLAASTPSYDWKAFLNAAGMGAATDVIVRQPDYVKAMNDILANTPASTWREYLTFKVLDDAADLLPSTFQQPPFEFRGKTMSGQQTMAPRWKRAVATVDGALGDATGKLYVEKYFPPEAKTRMDQLVRNMLNAYRVGIDSLEWMSPETKKAAQDKLAHFTVKIGYNTKPRDYSKIVIKRDDLIGNATRVSEFNYEDM